MQHGKESGKPTNTARLLVRTVVNSVIVPFARRGEPWAASQLGPEHEQRFVLFPGPDARTIDREWLLALRERPCALVLLDGTWRQAGRMVRRAAGIDELERVALPAGAPSRWRIRQAPRADQLCTFETVVRLAALLGEPPAAEALERAFQVVLDAQGRNPACDERD